MKPKTGGNNFADLSAKVRFWTVNYIRHGSFQTVTKQALMYSVTCKEQLHIWQRSTHEWRRNKACLWFSSTDRVRQQKQWRSERPEIIIKVLHALGCDLG